MVWVAATVFDVWYEVVAHGVGEVVCKCGCGCRCGCEEVCVGVEVCRCEEVYVSVEKLL